MAANRTSTSCVLSVDPRDAHRVAGGKGFLERFIEQLALAPRSLGAIRALGR
jgi:hypothetical protein